MQEYGTMIAQILKRLQEIPLTGKFFLSLGATGCALGLTSYIKPSTHQALASSLKRPNIIFILADDLGIGELSCYGADNYKTPNIDKIASKGLRFTNAYTPPLSGPSRATILTGRYLFRTGATNQDAVAGIKPSDEILIPSVLKPSGYSASMIGKWSQFSLTPHDFGFDDYLMFQGSGQYWNTQPKAKNYEVNGETVPLRDGEYLPDMMHRHLVDFITTHRDQPFFVYYSLSHVHANILPTPDSSPLSKNIYVDNMTYMDKLVGQLLTELDRLKLRENTIIVFFGDNGTANARADSATIDGRRLIGQKGTMLEGGSLEPLIVSWPGITPEGKVTSDLISSADFLPTFAEIAGAKLPENRIIDGQSFNAQIRGEKGNPREWVYIQLANKWYVREAGWKLNQMGELYDMSKAPFEEIPVLNENISQDAKAARVRLQAALNQLNPAGGIPDTGDGSGRHANRNEKK